MFAWQIESQLLEILRAITNRRRPPTPSSRQHQRSRRQGQQSQQSQQSRQLNPVREHAAQCLNAPFFSSRLAVALPQMLENGTTANPVNTKTMQDEFHTVNQSSSSCSSVPEADADGVKGSRHPTSSIAHVCDLWKMRVGGYIVLCNECTVRSI
jgi:hypothetical protein